MSKAYLNGTMIDLDEAMVSVRDSGFLYGIGLFETMRCVGGRVFALDAHLDRLAASAETLQIAQPFGRAELAKAVNQTVQANGLSEARIRLTVSGGVQQAEHAEPTLLVTATALGSYPAEHYAKGVRVALSDFRQNVEDPTTGHKTTNFFARLVALQQAHAKGTAEALWFTHGGLLAEGCISNVFIVTGQTLRTPRLETPVMPGIARHHVLNVAEEQGITCRQEDLTINDLLAADEVFITNVIMLILPVVGIEAHTVGDARPGPVTQRLATRLAEYIEQIGANEGARHESC